MDIFTDSLLAADGSGAVLVCLRREGSRKSTLLLGQERDGAFDDMPVAEWITGVAGGGGGLAFATNDELALSRDGGRSWTRVSAPVRPFGGPVAFAGETLWVGARDRVWILDWDEHVLRERWRLPSDERGTVTAILGTGEGEGLVLTDRGRVFRARRTTQTLEDWSQGLPLIQAEVSVTPTVGAIDGAHLACLGGLYLRRDDEEAWSAADAREAGPALAGVVRSGSAQWLPAPWSSSDWVGTDGLRLLRSDPAGSLAELWRPPTMGAHYVRDLTAGRSTVFASLRRCTRELPALAVHPDLRVEALALGSLE